MLKFPLRYLAPVAYYALMSSREAVRVAAQVRFDKREKAIHRTVIADANGVMNLTVPIEKPRSLSTTTVDELVISGHNSWWNIHFSALKSAYGRTPFFEYYEYDFEPFYRSEWVGRRLADYDLALDALLRRLLYIDTRVEVSAEKASPRADFNAVAEVPYYQVRAGRFGFVGGLSVVDLLFNMGPEAQLVLAKARAGLGGSR